MSPSWHFHRLYTVPPMADWLLGLYLWSPSVPLCTQTGSQSQSLEDITRPQAYGLVKTAVPYTPTPDHGLGMRILITWPPQILILSPSMQQCPENSYWLAERGMHIYNSGSLQLIILMAMVPVTPTGKRDKLHLPWTWGEAQMIKQTTNQPDYLPPSKIKWNY